MRTIVFLVGALAVIAITENALATSRHDRPAHSQTVHASGYGMNRPAGALSHVPPHHFAKAAVSVGS